MPPIVLIFDKVESESNISLPGIGEEEGEQGMEYTRPALRRARA
jgi:hypothetical protein